MTRKHLFAATSFLLMMTLWLFSCQVIAPEHTKTNKVKQEAKNEDKPEAEKITDDKKAHSGTIDSDTPLIEKENKLMGISDEEGMPAMEESIPMTKDVIETIAPTDMTIKCVESITVPSYSVACSPTSTISTTGTYTTTYFDATSSDAVYTEAPKVEGALSATSKSFSSDMAGKLTAGEINDFEKWKMWEDIADHELEAYKEIWKINCDDRYSVFVRTKSGSPITDAIVRLKNIEGSVWWQTKSDNNGRAELWGRFEQDDTKKKNCVIEIIHHEKTYTIHHPKTFRNGVNVMKIDADCDIPHIADIVFTVDATGSMGDEISYLQAELIDVMNKVKTNHKDIELRLGSVFYRDFSDTYVTIDSKLDADLEITREFVSAQYADGGGDGPEAVEEALAASNKLNWSKTARARLMFLILDAPPHGDHVVIEKIKKQTKEAAKAGIRIIPIVASGGGYDMDKSLEYLMRSCALATNGTYVFLTDHSGIGGAHTAPTTDHYEVETLNDLLLRVISQYLYIPECNVEEFVLNQEIQDTSEVLTEILPITADSVAADSSTLHIVEPVEIFTMKCYPNPASQYFTAETSIQVHEMFLSDNNGKIIERIVPTGLQTRIEVGELPTGIYHLKAWINEKWASTRIVVTRI